MPSRRRPTIATVARSGCRRCVTPRARPKRRTRSCWRVTPTRSTPRASTASCAGHSTTTPWSSATAATSCRSPAGSSSRPGPATGFTPARFGEPARPGHWLDPGPFGCLGTGAGYAIAARIAHPSSQVVLLLGDGAAGFSLMDVDTLVRHRLPVVIVVGNNSVWGLEKGPMQMIYGYDVAAELTPRTRYDDVVRALGGAGEMVTDPRGI